MSECTHDCGSCSANCSERKQESLVAQPHKDSHIKKVIGVVSGKGGVGKSMVTSMSAVLMNRRGYRSAVSEYPRNQRYTCSGEFPRRFFAAMGYRKYAALLPP